MLYTNLESPVFESIKKSLINSDSTSVAVGYISSSGLKLLSGAIDQHIRLGRPMRILAGMALFEGLQQSEIDFLTYWDTVLRKAEMGEVRLAWQCPYHGKIYVFEHPDSIEYLVGSSNLTSAGLARNTECNIWGSAPRNSALADQIMQHLDFIFSPDFSISLRDGAGSIPVVTSSCRTGRVTGNSRLVTPASSAAPGSLMRVALPISVHPPSGLNWNFGRGRPRSWYECYIPVPKRIQESGFFPPPKAPFRVVTDDGEEFQCMTAGTNGKNLESHPTLDILGKWIKGRRLAEVGLRPGDPVTREHLAAYGREHIEITRLPTGVYFFDFSRI